MKQKKSPLFYWVVIVNGLFLFGFIAVSLLVAFIDSKYIHYFTLMTAGLNWLTILPITILTYYTNFLTAIVAIILNTIYLPKLVSLPIPKWAIRAAVLITSSVIFFEIASIYADRIT